MHALVCLLVCLLVGVSVFNLICFFPCSSTRRQGSHPDLFGPLAEAWNKTFSAGKPTSNNTNNYNNQEKGSNNHAFGSTNSPWGNNNNSNKNDIGSANISNKSPFPPPLQDPRDDEEDEERIIRGSFGTATTTTATTPAASAAASASAAGGGGNGVAIGLPAPSPAAAAAAVFSAGASFFSGWLPSTGVGPDVQAPAHVHSSEGMQLPMQPLHQHQQVQGHATQFADPSGTAAVFGQQAVQGPWGNSGSSSSMTSGASGGSGQQTINGSWGSANTTGAAAPAPNGQQQHQQQQQLWQQRQQYQQQNPQQQAPSQVGVVFTQAFSAVGDLASKLSNSMFGGATGSGGGVLGSAGGGGGAYYNASQGYAPPYHQQYQQHPYYHGQQQYQRQQVDESGTSMMSVPLGESFSV
jgi:hypothetical protein